jgi:hypothetical protein
MYIYSIQSSVPQIEDEQATTKEKTIVSVSEVSKLSGTEKLPAGFPQGVPVELESIEESMKTEFPDRGIMQYTVTYSSNASSTDIQKQYETFFDTESYVKKPLANEVATLVQLRASKDNDDFSVVIEPVADQKSRVYVIFLDRK